MIEALTLARPYAKAIYDLGKNHNNELAWLNFLNLASSIVKNPLMFKLIKNYSVPEDAKVKVFLEIVTGTISIVDAMQNFLYVLASNARLTIIPEIYIQFQEIYNFNTNTRNVNIVSACELQEEQLPLIKTWLEKYFGSVCNLNCVYEPTLLRGLKAISGSRVIDLSAKGQLAELYTALCS